VGLAWQMSNKTVLRAGYGIVWDALPSRSQYGQHQFETWGWPQFSGIDTGDINREGQPIVPLDTLLTNLPFALPSPDPWNRSGWFNDPDRKDAYSHQWHLEIQREMANNLMMSVAYVGSQNGRLEYSGVAQAATRPGVDTATGRRLTAAEVDQLRPYPYLKGSWRYEDDIGMSSFHSFQYKLQRRFSSGLSTVLNYTWSKSIDTSSGWFAAENGIGGNAAVQNYHDRDSNRAVSGYDVPHLLTLGTLWELPFGKGKPWLQSGPASWFFGNWQTNWFLMARSGQPFTIEVGGDPANIGNTNVYSRANLVGDPKLDNPTAAQWFNPAAFAIPVNSFGSAGRNILRTDGLWNVDFSLFKNILIKENTRLELRFEAYNVFNHIDLGNPATRIDQPNPGRITLLSHTPRQLQFGFRFVF
jgi:hypothetical protein